VKYIKVFEQHTNNNPYTDYCNTQDLDSVKELIQKGVDPSVNNNVVLVWASYFGYSDIVELLLNDSRVDPSDKHNEALKVAIRKGHINIVKLLLNDSRIDLSDLDKYDADFNTEVDKLLNSAKSINDDILILLLRQPYIKNNISDRKLLHYMKPFLDDVFIKMNE